MVRLVSIDPGLLAHADETVRRRTWAQVIYNCGWRRGTVLAENPNLKKLICKVPDGTSSKAFQEFVIRVRQKGQSLQVGGLEGDSWFTRAMSTSLIDYLLTEEEGQGCAEPRVVNIDRYFDDFAEEQDLYPLKDPRFLKSASLLVIGSSRVDVIDKYQPLYSLNPVFRHWLKVFSKDGEFRRHLTNRPRLNIHLAHKDSDSARLAIQPTDSALDILGRMKAADGTSAEGLNAMFEVHFYIWEGKPTSRNV